MIQDIQHSITLLKHGGIGVMPTDTVYGIVASARDPKAVARVEALKGRQQQKPLIVLITQAAQMQALCPTISMHSITRAEELWARRGDDYAFLMQASAGVHSHNRGISVVVPCHDACVSYLHKGTGGIAFRRITHNVRTPEVRMLCDIIDVVGPVIATSANYSGGAVVRHSAQAEKIFGTACDFYIGGFVAEQHPSLVVGLDDDVTAPLRIIRQ